ncbi:MAG: carbonic anhydrase [Rickettsiales bacterium]|nr:carbonic anhydrase [Rickettsiales bacterium]
MSDISKLVGGFRIFKSTTFPRQKDIIHHLLEQNHKPSTMIISCCDLRISPSEIFAANPGEFYIINNIGSIVPKFSTEGIHGILAAIEYGVTNLEVENIIVFGHAKCDGLRTMFSEDNKKNKLSQSLKVWFETIKDAKIAVETQMPNSSLEEQQIACEKESLIISLNNLMTYPYIAERLKKDKIKIFAWHFDIENGEIMAFDAATKFFEPIS